MRVVTVVSGEKAVLVAVAVRSDATDAIKMAILHATARKIVNVAIVATSPAILQRIAQSKTTVAIVADKIEKVCLCFCLPHWLNSQLFL